MVDRWTEDLFVHDTMFVQKTISREAVYEGYTDKYLWGIR